MTRIADLPGNLQEITSALGFTKTDDVAPTRTDPARGDRLGDEQVTLHLRGTHDTGFLQVHTDDTVTYFSESDAPSLPIAVAGISRWAAAIDPTSHDGLSPEGEWPAEIRRAEAAQSRGAIRALQDATGIRPGRRHYSCEPEPAATCDARIYATSAMHEFTNLPIGHPAKDFMEGVLMAWGAAIRAIPAIANTAAREEAGPAIYNTNAPIALAMKSVKAFYEAGFIIAKQFPHLASKRELSILYPAAGNNVGALATAMALIDAGLHPTVIRVQYTEIDTHAPAEARRVLQQWIDATPHLDGTIEFATQRGRESGGTRQSAPFLYKGHRIILTYAMADSPGTLYFHPKDAAASDVVMIHDAYGDTSSTETLFLRQLLPQIVTHPQSIHPKAIVITNEHDQNPRRVQSDNPTARFSVLPLRGWGTSGSFGHGGDYPVRSPLSGVTWWSMKELGQAGSRSALIFSTDAPLIQAVKNDPGFDSMTASVDFFVDFAQLAGGHARELPADPGENPRSFTSGIDRSASKSVRVRNITHLVDWAVRHVNTVSGRDRDLLVLTTARLILQSRIEGKSLDVPSALITPLHDTLVRNGISVPSEAATAIVLQGGAQQLQRIDHAIFSLQHMTE